MSSLSRGVASVLRADEETEVQVYMREQSEQVNEIAQKMISAGITLADVSKLERWLSAGLSGDEATQMWEAREKAVEALARHELNTTLDIKVFAATHGRDRS